jgi:hypothetical protein
MPHEFFIAPFTEFEFMGFSAVQLHRQLNRRRIQPEVFPIGVRIFNRSIDFHVDNIPGKTVTGRFVRFGLHRFQHFPAVLVPLHTQQAF